MGAARHALAHAPAAAAPGGARARVLRRGSRARAAGAALRQPKPHNRHLPHLTDVPQESLSAAAAGWHSQRHHRLQQRLQ